MRLRGIQKIRHRPCLLAADDIRQTGGRRKQVGLRQAVQRAVRFERAQKILCEVRA